MKNSNNFYSSPECEILVIRMEDCIANPSGNLKDMGNVPVSSEDEFDID